MNFISIQDLYFSYADETDPQPHVNAVDGVSLTIDKGEFVAVIGHNGCGKSTLAKHLNAMLLPDSGKVIVDGDDTSDETKTWDIRERVGLVLQNPDNQLVAGIVEEDVAFGPENLGVEPGEIRRRVDEALKAVPKGKRSPTAEQGVAFCSQLFKLEEQFKDLLPEERKDKRLEQEKPVLDAMQAWANTRNAAQKSKLGIALNYLKNNGLN